MDFKIFIGEKPIHFTDKLNAALKKLSGEKGTVLYENTATVDAVKLMDELNEENRSAAIILSADIEAIKKDFISHFTRIDAAGGVVQNDNKEILFIFRRGKWDLPKGKKEEDETPEICAEREIEEETGAGHLHLKKKIGETRHVYAEKGKTILKKTDWFWFSCSGKQKIKAQEEEDITEVRWIATKDIREPMLNTYESIREVMRTFFDEP